MAIMGDVEVKVRESLRQGARQKGLAAIGTLHLGFLPEDGGVRNSLKLLSIFLTSMSKRMSSINVWNLLSLSLTTCLL